MRILNVPERGYLDLDPSIWIELERAPEFRRLHDQGVVEVAYRSAGRVRLKGTSYVGSAVCGRLMLRCTEKVPGALAAVLHYATHCAFRLANASAPAGQTRDLTSLIVEQFLNLVSTYAAGGRQFEYRAIPNVGALAGGKLDIARTVRLRARGLGHLLAFSRQTACFDTRLNKVVLAALIEIERIQRIAQLPGGLLSRARGLALLFSDCRDYNFLSLQRSRQSVEANAIAMSAPSVLIADIASLASVLLSDAGFDPTSELAGKSPRTWFLNLERLFEKAVRNIIRDTAGASKVFRGEDAPRHIFDLTKDEYRANPDIVIVRDGTSSIVGDAKYKQFYGSAVSKDIYQLLAHAAAFEARDAFLVFPSEQFVARQLGRTLEGTSVTLFGVRLAELATDVGAISTLLTTVKSSAP